MSKYHFLVKGQFIAAIFLVAILMNMVIGCRYYQSRMIDKRRQVAEINRAINKDLLVLLSQNGETWEVNNVKLSGDELEVNVVPLSEDIRKMHEDLSTEKYRNNRYTLAHHRQITKEVVISLDSSEQVGVGAMTIPLDKIDNIEVFSVNVGPTLLSHLGVIFGLTALIFILILLIKSSCPYIYSYDGEKYVFEGESYGGAIFEPLERKDYIPIGNLWVSEEGLSTIRIANELKEKQYINEVALFRIYTPIGTSAFLDKQGKVQTITTPIEPLRALANEKDYYQELSTIDDQGFFFDNPTETGSIILEFPNEQSTGKLLINAKGSIWLDYLYGQFSELFGSSYPAFIERQDGKTPEQLNQYIEDQNLNLKIYEETVDGWKYVDHYEMVGPLGKGRNMVLPIPPNGNTNKTRKFKLETGFMFWELYYAGLDYTENNILEMVELKPISAIDHNSTEQRAQILSDDNNYVDQFNVGDYLTVDFVNETSTFDKQVNHVLAIKGYYKHIREFEGIPQVSQLLPFRTPNYFGKYSRMKYLEMNPVLISRKD